MNYFYVVSCGRRGFQRLAIPMGEIGRGFIATLKEREELLFGSVRFANGVIRQDEFVQRRIIPRLGRLQWSSAKTIGLRVGIAVKERIRSRRAARPEPAAAHLVRIGIASHPIGNVGYSAGVRRRRASRESSDREIEGAPEEVNGTGLAVKARAKAPEHIRRRNEDAPASVRVLGIVGSMSFVDIEWCLALDFRGSAVDVNRHPERR